MIDNWNKVKDRLPDQGSTVLCFNRFDGQFVAEYIGGTYMKWCLTNNGQTDFDEPTHWMDSPKNPYIGDEE